MDINNDTLLIFAAAALRRRRQRSCWTRDIFKLRKQQGYFHNLISEMRLSDTESFVNFFRMSPAKFDQLLSLVGPRINRNSTFFRETISPTERLAVTLRYLASGDSMTSLSYGFRYGISTISRIIKEVSAALWDELMPIYLPAPNEEAWIEIASQFESVWNFPNCIGAIDGKHIVIQAPYRSGSAFFNYKNSFSIVLLAVCDAKYRFTIVDIGGAGRQSDGGTFNNSFFGKHLQNGTLNIPADSPVPPTSNNLLPYVFVADEAFPLKINLMRPYARKDLTLQKRIYNYRLSRARRTIENAFGIMASRFRIFRRPIIAGIETIQNCIKACVCLHNFLRTEELKLNPSERLYCPVGFTDSETEGTFCPGRWRDSQGTAMVQLGQTSSNMYGKRPAEIRDSYLHYFNTVGAVHWQARAINSVAG